MSSNKKILLKLWEKENIVPSAFYLKKYYQEYFTIYKKLSKAKKDLFLEKVKNINFKKALKIIKYYKLEKEVAHLEEEKDRDLLDDKSINLEIGKYFYSHQSQERVNLKFLKNKK